MEMRRKDKLMAAAEVEDVLKDTEYGILGTYGENGYPYAVPVNYVYKDNKIYLHGTNASGHNNINIRQCKKVSFTVVRNTEVIPESFNTKFQSVICFGDIRVLEEGKEPYLKLFLEKYSPDFMEEGMKYIEKAKDKAAVYEITLVEKTGKEKM